jgi:hypothetical protein
MARVDCASSSWLRRVPALGFLGWTLLGCETLTLPGIGSSGSGAPPPAPPAIVAHLTSTAEDVQVTRSGQSLTYAPGMPLRSGDRIRTGSATVATIDYTDGNTVYMNNNTSVMVGSIRVFIGEIFNAIVHLGSSSEAYTNDLSAAAEGTKFLMRADPRGTTVIVVEGRVRCTPTSGGAWHPITLTSNQQISGTVRAYSGPTPVDARRAAVWVDQAARRLKRPPMVTPPSAPPPAAPSPSSPSRPPQPRVN